MQSLAAAANAFIAAHPGPGHGVAALDVDCVRGYGTLESKVNLAVRCALKFDALLTAPSDFEEFALARIKDDSDFGGAFDDVNEFKGLGLGRLVHAPVLASHFKASAAYHATTADLLAALLDLRKSHGKVSGWEAVVAHVAAARKLDPGSVSTRLSFRASLAYCISLLGKAKAMADAREKAAMARVAPLLAAEAKVELEERARADAARSAEEAVAPMRATLAARVAADPMSFPTVQSALSRDALLGVVAAALHGEDDVVLEKIRCVLVDGPDACGFSAAVAASRRRGCPGALAAASLQWCVDVHAAVTALMGSNPHPKQAAWQVIARFGMGLLLRVTLALVRDSSSSASGESADAGNSSNTSAAEVPGSLSVPLTSVLAALADANAISSAEADELPDWLDDVVEERVQSIVRALPRAPERSAPSDFAGGSISPAELADLAAEELEQLLDDALRGVALNALSSRVSEQLASRGFAPLGADDLANRLETAAALEGASGAAEASAVLAAVDRLLAVPGDTTLRALADGRRSLSETGAEGGSGSGVSGVKGGLLAELQAVAAVALRSEGVRSSPSDTLGALRRAVASHFGYAEPGDACPQLALSSPEEEPASIQRRISAVADNASAAGVVEPFAALPGARRVVGAVATALPAGVPPPIQALIGVPMLADVEASTAWAALYAPAGYGSSVGEFLARPVESAVAAAAGLRFIEAPRGRWTRVPPAAGDCLAALRGAAMRRDALGTAAEAVSLLCSPVGMDSGDAVRRQLAAVFDAAEARAPSIDLCTGMLERLPAFAHARIGSSLLSLLLVELQQSVAEVAALGHAAKSLHAALCSAAGAILCGSAGLSAPPSRDDISQLLSCLLAPTATQREPVAHQPPSYAGITLCDPVESLPAEAERTRAVVEDTSAFAPAVTASDASGLARPVIDPDQVAEDASARAALCDIAETALPPSESIARALIAELRSEYTDLPGESAALRTAVGATQRLSGELYRDATHFLFELIQNADDASYAEAVAPQLSFSIRGINPAAAGGVSLPGPLLSVESNERGFRILDVRSISCSGASSKGASAGGAQTGKKGIGFKSVFSVSRAPEVHSGYVHLVFDTTGELGPLGMLAPTWRDPPPRAGCSDADARWPGSAILLPLLRDGGKNVVPASKVADAVRGLGRQPDVLLFLRRLVSSREQRAMALPVA